MPGNFKSQDRQTVQKRFGACKNERETSMSVREWFLLFGEFKELTCQR